jgi:glycerate-2-kinase
MLLSKSSPVPFVRRGRALPLHNTSAFLPPPPSGPTVPDATICADALSIWKRITQEKRGSEAFFTETPKPGEAAFARSSVHVIATPQQSLDAAADAARAGEFCMGLAQALQGQAGVYAFAADTDGIDGVEDNAGAVVTPDTLALAAQKSLKLADFLDRNDAYGFFEAVGGLVMTGPTHINVNDFRAILVL